VPASSLVSCRSGADVAIASSPATSASVQSEPQAPRTMESGRLSSAGFHARYPAQASALSARGPLGMRTAGGVRAASYSFESSYHGCLQATSVTAVAPIAEARVRGELWVSPWLTAGLTAGASVLEKHAWMGGLYLGVHTRAFGGER